MSIEATPEAIEKSDKKPESTDTKPKMTEETPIVTRHSLQLSEGGTFIYDVTTGRLPLKNEKGEIEAQLFFMAYTKVLNEDELSEDRPLMFSFNGGPGSSSVWLHLGALGPKRVRLEDDGALPAPPYRLVDNPDTWLGNTDLVFIDPVGTGYSRALNEDLNKKFWNVKGDIEAVGEFIRLYLSRYKRWTSPLYLVGESYGTTRAAGLAGHLIEKGIAFNGIILVSSVLNFQTLEAAKGNDLPYILYLPTYAATAHFHNKLGSFLQEDLMRTLEQVQEFALGDFATALMHGDSLPAEERKRVATEVAFYTGLSVDYVEKSDLRVEIMRFCKELLREEDRSVGRLDSRFKGIDALTVSHNFDHDPSMSAIRPPYTACFNHYVRTALGYETDEAYEILGGVKSWDFNQGEDGWVSYTDTSEALRAAFAKNPHLRVFVASGFYDLATPYFATRYTLDHLGLDKSLRNQMTTRDYTAGHMMYIDVKCLKRLANDVSAWLKGELKD